MRKRKDLINPKSSKAPTMTPDEIETLLNQISGLYESAIEAFFLTQDRPTCYAAFVPYHSWRMPPEDCAQESLILSFPDAAFQQRLDAKGYEEPNYFSFGEFYDGVDEVKLVNTKLKAALLAWYSYMHGDSVEMEDASVAARLGKAIASACRNLNAKELSDGGKRFASEFVVFTDYIEPTSGMPGLADCVSDDWLREHKVSGLVADYMERSEL